MNKRFFPLRLRYKYPEESLRIQIETKGKFLGDDGKS